jgi:hypothetical protein
MNRGYDGNDIFTGNKNKELRINTTKYGEILGNPGYMESACEKHNRRKRPTEQSEGVKRENKVPGK